MSGLFIGGIQNKVPIDGVHVPIERRPVLVRFYGGKICLDELRQNGRRFFLVDEADCTGKQFGSRRLSSLKRECRFLCPFQIAQHATKPGGGAQLYKNVRVWGLGLKPYFIGHAPIDSRFQLGQFDLECVVV